MAMTGQCGLKNITSPLPCAYPRFLASLLRACHARHVGTGTMACRNELVLPGEYDGDHHAVTRDCRRFGDGYRFERLCAGQLYPPRLLPAERIEQGMRLRYDGAVPAGQEGQQGHLRAEQRAAEPLGRSLPRHCEEPEGATKQSRVGAPARGLLRVARNDG